MDYLKSKPSLGRITLLHQESDNETFSIGDGSFSISQENGFLFLNFWIKAEYEVEMSEDQTFFVSGPILEIYVKKKSDSLKIDKPIILNLKIEETKFYHQIHQEVVDATLKITNVVSNYYEIEFSGKPSYDMNKYSLKGICKLPLKKNLSKYW